MVIRRWPFVIVSLVVVGTLVAACSSSSKSSSSQKAAGAAASSSTSSSTSVVLNPANLGTGVTPTTIKLGVSLVDFTCIQQFVTQIRQNQQQIYQDFINNVNQHGGIDGKQIVPVYHTFCPIGSTGALTECTQFTEDDHVFAVIGTFVDFSGDAQTCLAKDHNTPLMTFQLSQAIENQSPPGMIIEPGFVPERVDGVLMSLLDKQGTLNGKKVAILGEQDTTNTINSALVPALQKYNVQTGSTAILNITGTDTSAAQEQLDSFIEKWKTEHVDAVFVSGTQVLANQFIDKVVAGLPGVVLITDTDATVTMTYGKQETKAGKKPNSYEGMLTAAGPTAREYDQSDNWKYCANIYQQQTGMVAPNAEAVIPLPNGKTLDTYGTINDSCELVTMFHDIAAKVGPELNVANWLGTVSNYGTITDRGGGPYASLHTGHYNVQDSFRLQEFDSSIPPEGDWNPVTPLQDITGS
jgi:hypothetical protein